MNAFLRIALSLAILLAPGCGMVETWTGVADAEALAEKNRIEADTLRRQNELLDLARNRAADELDLLSSRLDSALEALEDARSSEVDPAVLVEFEAKVAELEGSVASASMLLDSTTAELEQSRKNEFAAQLEAARSAGASEALQKQFDKEADAVVVGAGAAGGPGGGMLAQGILATLLTGGVAWGKIRGAKDSVAG